MKFAIGAVGGIVGFAILKRLTMYGLREYWRMETRKGWSSA